MDTNLLLLLLVGSFDQNKIPSTKRIHKYNIEDFYTIVRLINYYTQNITITPNIFTEICNLSDKLNLETNYKFFQFLETFLNSQNERIELSKATMTNNNKCYFKLGICDASIFSLAKENNLIITDDLELYHFIISHGLHSINYNHLIQIRYD